MNRTARADSCAPAIPGDDVLQTLRRIEGHVERIEQRLSKLELGGDDRIVSDFLSVETFARQAHKASWTIRNACRLGHIRAVRSKNGVGVGGRWRIPRSELARVLAAGQIADSNRLIEEGSQ